MYDPAQRRGITLTINSSAGGYQSQGTDRHVHFGIDNAQMTDWQDCGHPNPASNYVINSLTVYKGKLYAATSGVKMRRTGDMSIVTMADKIGPIAAKWATAKSKAWVR